MLDARFRSSPPRRAHPARAFRATLAVALVLILPSARADEASAESGEVEEVVFTEQVVVTATGNETPSGEVASTVTVLTGEDLDTKQVRSLPDALREVPGVDVRRNGGPGSSAAVFIRGADSDHTLVLVDGVEMNDPSSPNRLAFLDHLTPDNVERIEVLRGPQSTLYGSDAIGGVVQIITERGAGDPTHDLWVEGGRYATFRGGFSSSGEAGRLDYAVSGSHTDTDGFSATSAGTEPDPYRNTNLSGRLGFDNGAGLGVDLFVRHLDAEVAFDGFANELDHFLDSRQSLIKIEPRLSLFDGRWQQRWAVRSTRHERDTTGDLPTRAKGQLSALQWRNDLKLGPVHGLTLGIEGEWEDGEFATFDDSARTLSVYAQDQVTLGQKLFGTLGVRLDDHDSFGSEATYRLALGYRIPGRGLTIRASQGTGFKSPSLSELHGFGGNPGLEPETTRGFDVGLEQVWARGRVLAGAAYFSSRIDDLIMAICDPVTFECLNFNVDEAETSGIEAHVDIRPIDDLTLRGSYTYTDTEAKGAPAGFGLTEGSRLLRRPEHKGSLDVHRRFVAVGADLTLSLLYVGERDDIDPVTFSTAEADDYWLANLAASWNVTQTVQAFGRVENLLGEEYEDVLGFGTADLSGYVGLRVGF